MKPAWPDCDFTWDSINGEHTHRCIEPSDHELDHMCDCGERHDTGHEVE